MTKRDKPLVCEHGLKVGIVIHPGKVSPGGDYIVHKITMPICGQCLLKALGLSHEPSPST